MPALIVFALQLGASAAAQTSPSPAEYAAYTGLHRAAANGSLMEIRSLLAERVNPNHRDLAGRTPMHVAAFGAGHEAVRALVAGGGDINALENDRYDVITIAAVKDDVRMVKLAIELGGNPKMITSRYDGTALIAAAHLGHTEVVGELIAAGAPLDHVNNLGWTALMEAVVLGDGGCLYRKSRPGVLVVQTAENGRRNYGFERLNGPVDRAVLVKRPVSAGSIVIGRIGLQDLAQVRCSHNHDMVKAFTADRADQPLGIRVLPG